jgi:putative lipoprotein
MAFWVKALTGVLFAILCVAAPSSFAAQITLTGEVTYRERIALPEGARLRVQVVDTTAGGSPTRVEAEAAIATPGQQPLTFTLIFDERLLDPSHDHALFAEISSGLELWFRSSQPFPVNPLAPEGDIAVLVDFTGRMVQSSETIAEAVMPIVDLNWRALAIKGVRVDLGVDSTLSIASDMRAGGKGGCNNWFAQAELESDKITFSAIASTKMACASTILTEQETRFFAALAAARLWRMDGTELVMLDTDGREVLRFAVSPR